MEMRGTPQELWTWLARRGSDVHAMYLALRHIPSQMLSYQQAVLFLLASYHRKAGGAAAMLDIGTGAGHSAAVMAVASPRARIMTMTPKAAEAIAASRFTRPYENVEVWTMTSEEFRRTYDGPDLVLVFVDGDHKHAERDVPWWEWVRPGGVMLFHDYSPTGSRSPAQRVVDAVDRMAVRLGRRPDVMIVDTNGDGMAGFRKRQGD